MYILIGSAWPYANGSLHIGHIAALLPGDVLARYHRAKGDSVYYVSGSDCHGTPVAIRAAQENKTPEEISNYYHKEFTECFRKLGFEYDFYTKTSTKEHKQFVTEFHEQLYQSKYVYEKQSPQAFCEGCNSFLADRFIVGKCPSCGSMTRGDQCDACETVLEIDALIEPHCSVCHREIVFKETKHLYIAISELENQLREFIENHPKWRKNAISFSNRYLKEGLRDRAITRDLTWGIDVPKEGYENKKIYIWAENVLGYLSASMVVAEERKEDYSRLWGSDSKHYYVHGKDNIPFHTIILPSLLIAHGYHWHLPDEFISSEHLTFDGRKISTSQNHAVWVKDIVDKLHPDSLRYFLIANGPEKKDTDFTWQEYIKSHNGELLGAYGNFINRTLVFISKYFDNRVPAGSLDSQISNDISDLFISTGNAIECGKFRDGLDNIFEFVRKANKYFDTEKPWETRSSNIEACENTLYHCVQIIANLAILLYPFLPFSSEKVCEWLGIDHQWKPHYIESGYQISEPEILFERITQPLN